MEKKIKNSQTKKIIERTAVEWKIVKEMMEDMKEGHQSRLEVSNEQRRAGNYDKS